MADAAGAILLRAGVLGPQSLAAAAAFKQREGGTLGEALVRLGLLDEERLVAAFQESLLVPAVAEPDLLRVPTAVLATVPAHLAAEHQVLPVEIDGEGNLTLAMADPTDNRAVDEVAAHTGRFVLRAVAGPLVLRRALTKRYGASLTKPPPAKDAKPVLPLPPSAHAVPAAAVPPERPPESVLSALARAVTGEPPRPPRKTRPPQAESAEAPEGRKGRGHKTPAKPMKALSPIPLDKPVRGPAPPGTTLPGLGAAGTELLGPVARLRAASTRDEIVTVLLDYASQLAARVGLFVIQKGQLTCLDGRGPDHVVVAMKWFTIPVDAPSPFRDVLTSRAPYIGSLEDTAESRAFRNALGGTSGRLLLLPLLVGDRAVGVLYADELRADLGQLSRELETLSREAGAAFARIILSQKGPR